MIDQIKSLSIDLAGDGFIRISKPTVASVICLIQPNDLYFKNLNFVAALRFRRHLRATHTAI